MAAVHVVDSEEAEAMEQHGATPLPTELGLAGCEGAVQVSKEPSGSGSLGGGMRCLDHV